MEHCIIIDQLEKTYPKNVCALRDVSFTIPAGGVFAVLGPNGAGKSTLVKILSGLSRGTGGQVVVAGTTLKGKPNELARIIGVAGQENDLDPEARPGDLLDFQARLFGMTQSQAKERREQLLKEFSLEEFRGRRVRELSGGNKRKLHCALALVHSPQILFLDEPTVGMDPQARREFWRGIDTLTTTNGGTVILTTQYLEEADQRASHMALLAHGRLGFIGTCEQFKDEAARFNQEFTEAGKQLSLEDSYLNFLDAQETQLTGAEHE